jgi:excinuclease ABC subunit C
VFQVRKGKVIARLAYTLEAALDEPQMLLEAFLSQYYAQSDNLPREVLLPSSIDGASVLESWLGERRGTKVALLVPQRGAKKDLMDLVQRNATHELGRQRLVKLQASRSAATGGPAELAAALGLSRVPKRIEAFDISHLGGTDIVASMVVFVDGRPSKGDYRKFKLKTVHDNDDFASMREIILRRFMRTQQGDWPKPDLVIIDGGKGQLSAALDAISQTSQPTPPIFGLAKREEELFLPGQSEALLLLPGSPALHLVQQVRDEAHRFAVTFQRQQRGKRMIGSLLDSVAGLGPVRKRKLLERFGSVETMRLESEEALHTQGLLPEPVAHALYKALHD